jgi:FkbM family methyltransferase
VSSLNSNLWPRVQRHRDLVRALGVVGWINYQCVLRSPAFAARVGHRLRSQHARHPLYYRPGQTDLAVFWQIFIEREYACLDGLPIDGLIVDCGANVGYSSAYFLSRFPHASIFAIEPDSKNFTQLTKNLAAYGDRVECIQAGIWSHPCELVFREEAYRDGGAWAVQVREAGPGEQSQLSATDIPSILQQTGAERISLLKVDIERAELHLFDERSRLWIDRCDAIVIELHDDECREVFFKAIQDQPFQITTSGELTVCIREHHHEA